MEQHNYNKQHILNDLVSEYEAMSQKGTVGFYEESVFSSIIDYYHEEKNYESALSVVETALAQHTFSSFLYYKKAELLSIYWHRDPVILEDALIAIETATSLSPSDLRIKLLQAELLGCKGDYPDAFNLLDDIRTEMLLTLSDLEVADVYYCESLLHEQLQQYDLAFDALKEALLLNTRQEKALKKIWICVERSQKYKESISLFQSILDKDVDCYLAWYYLGHVYHYFGQFEEAIDAYEYAFITNKDFEWAYRDCAAICLETKDYRKALDCYEEALKFVDPDVDLLLHIGQCYQYLGNLTAAHHFYRRACILDDYNDEVFFHLGQCMEQQQNWAKAIYYYGRAIDLDDRREEYFAALGAVYYNLEKFEDAFHCFDTATELAPEQSIFWVQFAAFLYTLTYYEEAIEVLDDAEHHAVGEDLLYFRVVCLYKLGKTKEAIDVLAEALVENFAMHVMIYDYAPELRTNPAFQAPINYFQG